MGNHMTEHHRHRFLGTLAVAAVLAACTRDPNVLKHRYVENGDRYFKQEKFREAAIEYQNAIKLDSKFEEAHYALAQCDLKLGILAGAYQELTRATELKPDDAKAQLTLGNLLLSVRDFKHAQDIAQRVLSQDANNVEARVLLANSYAGLNNVEGSLEEMRGAIQLAPDRAGSYLNMALLELNVKQAPEAEKNFKKAVEADPKSVTALLALGNFCRLQNRLPEAEQEFQKAVGIEPQNPAPRGALAMLYLAEKDTAKAEGALAGAKQAAPQDPKAYRLLGDYYFGIGELGKAVDEYASIVHDHPDDHVARMNYIQLLIVANRADEATKLNDAVLKNNPKDLQALIYRGEILERQSKFSDAAAALQAALKTEPDNPTAHYFLGVAFNGTGDLDRAETEWREAARLRPSMIEPERALANTALLKGDFTLLRQTAQALIGSEPHSPEGYIFRGVAEVAQKNEADAEGDFQQAIHVAPQNPSAYTRLGELRLNQKKYPEAEKFFEQALDRAPQAAAAMRGLVAAAFAEKQPSKAIARLRTQIAQVPESADFQLLLGQALTQTGDRSGAEAAFEKAIGLNKNGVEAYLLLAQAQSGGGSLDQAIATLRRAIEQVPGDPRAYVLIGTTQETHGDWQAAQLSYTKALQVRPNDGEATNDLAYLMLEHNLNVDQALTLAQTARRMLPTLPNSADTLGWAYYKKGAYQLALPLLEDAAKALPGDAAVHYHLGMVYDKTGEARRAKQELEIALKDDPKNARNDDIRQLLGELNVR